MICQPLHECTPAILPPPRFDTLAACRAAAYHARQFSAVPDRGGEAEADDRQHLLLEAVRQWRWYDPSLGAPATFCALLMTRAAVSMHRRRAARKRGGDRRFVPAEAACAQPSPHDLLGDRLLRIDMESVLARLTPEDQQLCRLVMQMPVRRAAELLGICRNAAGARLRRLRPVFEAAGLDERINGTLRREAPHSAGFGRVQEGTLGNLEGSNP